MKLTGDRALEKARDIAGDHNMYIVSNPRGHHIHLLYRRGHERGRGILIHRATSARQILEATCRAAGVPVPDPAKAAEEAF